MSFRVFVLAFAISCCACKSDAPDVRRETAREVGEPAVAEAKAPEPAPAEPPQAVPSVGGPPVRKDGTIYGESELMGTRVSINVYLDTGKSAQAAGEAMQAALEEMARIEDMMSEWKPASELSQFNDAAGSGPRSLSPELFEVLSRSHAISAASDGAFDVTFHGVGQLWSFKPGSRPPSKEAIAKHLPLVDWRNLELQAEAQTAALALPGMKIGLGAIAKGYAVDRASAVLLAQGFRNHVVEAGGDTFVSGLKGGKPWRVGVQDPQAAGAIGALEVSDQSVVTSGDYQRFFEFEGKRYAHILDPRTGWPVRVEDSPRSVTVVAANATDADGFCTAVAVLGFEKGFAFAQERPEIEAIVISAKGEVKVTDGLRDQFITNE